MMYEVTLTQTAYDDIRTIYRYIALELQSPQNAISQFNRLEKAISSLNEFPERYPIYDKSPWNGRNLRIMPVDHYLVFYIPVSKTGTVTILRVMYGSRDIDKHLKNL